MKKRFIAIGSSSLCLTLLLSGCGSLDLWPFGGDQAQVRTSRPPNATHYLCKGGKSFYVRLLDNGNAAWIIYPDREVRFDKAGATPGARYSNGSSVLEVTGDQAALQDGPGISYTDCKVSDK